MRINTFRPAVLSTAFALTIALPTTPCVMAADSSGTITVSGKVTDNTCELENTDTPVVLDTVSAVSLMNAAGKDVAEKNFTIGLENCGAHASNVDITVTGTQDTDISSAFKNDAKESGATGVAMDLYSINGNTLTKLNPDGGEGKQPLEKNASSKLNFKAAYVGTKDTVTAGIFKSVVKFTLSYE